MRQIWTKSEIFGILMRTTLFFLLEMMPLNWLYDFVKLHIWEKSVSKVALCQ